MPSSDDQHRLNSNNDKAKYFEDLREQKEEYADKALNYYKRRINWFLVGFRTLGVLVILGSVSLPFLAQNAETNKWIISGFSLGVALCTALNSFFSWHLTWQKRVAVTAALEHYIANWEIGMVKAFREDYDKAKQEAHDATSYLFTQVFTTISQESEAFFAQLKQPDQAVNKEKSL